MVATRSQLPLHTHKALRQLRMHRTPSSKPKWSRVVACCASSECWQRKHTAAALVSSSQRQRPCHTCHHRHRRLVHQGLLAQSPPLSYYVHWPSRPRSSRPNRPSLRTRINNSQAFLMLLAVQMVKGRSMLPTLVLHVIANARTGPRQNGLCAVPTARTTSLAATPSLPPKGHT